MVGREGDGKEKGKDREGRSGGGSRKREEVERRGKDFERNADAMNKERRRRRSRSRKGRRTPCGMGRGPPWPACTHRSSRYSWARQAIWRRWVMGRTTTVQSSTVSWTAGPGRLQRGDGGAAQAGRTVVETGKGLRDTTGTDGRSVGASRWTDGLVETITGGCLALEPPSCSQLQAQISRVGPPGSTAQRRRNTLKTTLQAKTFHSSRQRQQ